VRKRLCYRRDVRTAPRPFSRNRYAYEKHLNLCAIAAWSRELPRPGFSTVEAFKLSGPDRSHPRAKGFSRSFGGRLAHSRATQAWDSTRRAWSSAEEFASERMRPCRLGAVNALPLSARGFRAGRGRGEWGSSPKASDLLKFTAVKINCNG